MKSHTPQGTSHDPALLKALAEASAWIVKLHGPERTPALEQGLQRWLAESPTHRYAFEHATETWTKTRAMVRRSAQVDIQVPRGALARSRRIRTRIGPAIAAAMLLLLIGVGIYKQQSGFITGIGERRTVVLDDGTQVTMNTSTRISVDYDQQRRHVHLRSGEALFEVAKRPDWPFVVSAGDREITALGTSFLVRRNVEHTAVTLLEGKVRVTSTALGTDRLGTHTSGATAAVPASVDGTYASLTLTPGQRVVFASNAPAQLDRPELQKLTAWQQGLVNLDDMTLARAVEEMNRYSTLRLSVVGPAANIHISGVFRSTDAENFAQAVALTHSLSVRRDGRQIVLSGTPQPPSESRFDRPR